MKIKKLPPEKQLALDIKYGKIEALKRYQEEGWHVNVPMPSHEPRSPLAYAISHEQWDIVRWALDQGARVNDYDVDGWGALHYLVASKSIEPEHVRWLIAAGADIHKVDRWERTPLLLAIERRRDQEDTEFFEELLKFGALMNVKMDDRSPLHQLAEDVDGHSALVQLLIQYGHAVNIGKIRTPLHSLARRNSLEAAKVLVAAGADWSLKDSDGQSVLAVAEDSIYGSEVFDYLRELDRAFKERLELDASTKDAISLHKKNKQNRI